MAAFPAYVTAAFSERGYPLDRTTAEAIEEATAVLDAELGLELELPYREQRRSPLELFREALEIVALSLLDTGVFPTVAESTMVEGDTYGLAPGSSSALGAEAHETHLAWGAAKASAFMTGQAAVLKDPVILLVTADRGDRDAILPVLKSPGVDCLSARNPAAVAGAIEQRAVLIAFVDLVHRSARGSVARLVDAGVPTVVYGDGVDDLTETGLLAQGVRAVVRRRDFVANPARFLPPLA